MSKEKSKQFTTENESTIDLTWDEAKENEQMSGVHMAQAEADKHKEKEDPWYIEFKLFVEEMQKEMKSVYWREVSSLRIRKIGLSKLKSRVSTK